MKPVLAAALCLGMAACSSGQGVNPVAKAIFSRVGAVVGAGDEAAAEPSAAPKRLTRAKIIESGLAMIRASVGEGTSPQTLMAVTDNGGYVMYASALRQSLTLRGALVTATRGIETDLLSTKSIGPDPIAQLMPLDSWPKTVRRVYHLAGGNSPEGQVVPVTCELTLGAEGEIRIVEITYPVRQVLEICSGDGFSFENAHMADMHTGAIWRSRQWIGFQSAEVNFDVLEPYTE